jgi:hypothetical protein
MSENDQPNPLRQEPVETVHPQDSTTNAAGSGQNVSPPPIRVIVESLPPTPAPSEEEKARKRRKKICEGLKSGLEVVAVLVALGLLCVTRRYVEYAKQQRDEMIEQNRIALEHNLATELQFRKQRRPYVAIPQIETQPLTNKRLKADATNYGETPARSVYASGVFKQQFDATWRDGTCDPSKVKTQDWKMAGPAIFQHSTEEIPIDIEETTIAWPPPYLAVCITFVDMYGTFSWENEPNKTYSIKHMFQIGSHNRKLTFTKVATSVETAEPEIEQ